MSTPAQQVFEFRGIDKLYVAEVLQDDANGYVCGTPVYLAPTAEIGKSTESSSDAHYYDNKAMIVINSESADTISITMAPPQLEKLAMIIGKSFDASTGMMIDSPRQNKYFAIMYRTKGTDGQYRYVSRLKGQFSIPEETYATEDDGTDANNTSCEFTGIYTEHEFTKGAFNGAAWEPAGAKGIVVDTRYGIADVSNFFSAVQTPDTIQTRSGVVILSPNTAAIEVDEYLSINCINTTSPAQSISFASSDTDVVVVSASGNRGCVIQGVSAGTATITVTSSGGLTSTCVVTVTAPEA